VFGNFLFVTIPSGLWFQKKFTSHCRVKITLSGRNGVSFRALSQRSFFLISTAFPVRDSRLHICSHSSYSLSHNVFILLSFSCVTNLSLLAGVCAACMLAYRCLQMKWWTAVTVVAIPSQRALLTCRYVSSGKCLVLAPRSTVVVPFCIICILHLIVVWFWQAIWLLEWSLQLPSFLAFYVSKGRAGRSNTSLRLLCFHFAVIWSLPSTCYMQGNWYCLPLP